MPPRCVPSSGPPRDWTIPLGLALSSGGVLSGTPTAAGSFTFTVTAADANSCAGSQSYTVAIGGCVSPAAPLLSFSSPTAAIGTSVTLTWTSTVGVGQGSYDVIKTVGGSPTTIASGIPASASPTVSYSYSVVGPAGPQDFKVKAIPSCNPALATFSNTATLTVSGCLKASPPPHLIIDKPIATQGSTATLTWDPPSQSFAGSYTVMDSTDGGATFTALGSTSGNQLAFAVQFPVGTTVIFEVVADPGCGPAGISDPSPTVSMQVVRTCPKAGDPVAQMDQVQVAVGDSWSLHWTATLPGPASAPAGVYEVRISHDDGATFQVAGTTTATTFAAVVPQSDAGKLIFLQVIAIPSCDVAGVSAGHSNVVVFSVLPGCEAPQAPRNPQIAAVGKHLGDPIFPTDQLSVSWDSPASGNPPSGYLFRINGDIESLVVGGTGTITRARGNGDPMTLFVRSVACSPQKGSAAVQSAPVALSLSPPGANFSISASPKVGVPVTFTDTSSPQATGWLWLFDDGTQSTVQSPSKTFATAGTHTVALIATNGAGSASKVQSFLTAPAGAAVLSPPSSERIPFAASGPDRRHAAVELSGAGAAWLRLISSSSVEETLFLRFLDGNGELVLERRLAMQAGSTVSHDLNAYGLKGSFTLELVGESSVSAAVMRTGRSTMVIQR